MNDIAAALTGSVAADGQTPMTGNLNANSNKIVNLAAGTISGNAVEYTQFTTATTTGVAITGGAIDGTTIGSTTPSYGRFSELIAPAGTTASRPSSPVNGDIRYNTTINQYEGYGNSAWGSLGGAGGSNTQVQYNNNGALAGSSALTFNGTALIATTLQSTNLSDGTNSTSTTNAINGSAKAWARFNASGSITGVTSYNVSSITYNATGRYVVNFTNAFTDANYSVSGTACRSANGNVPQILSIVNSPSAPATTSCSIGVNEYTGSPADSQYTCVSFFR
jgi:hypothetical protein